VRTRVNTPMKRKPKKKKLTVNKQLTVERIPGGENPPPMVRLTPTPNISLTCLIVTFHGLPSDFWVGNSGSHIQLSNGLTNDPSFFPPHWLTERYQAGNSVSTSNFLTAPPTPVFPVWWQIER